MELFTKLTNPIKINKPMLLGIEGFLCDMYYVFSAPSSRLYDNNSESYSYYNMSKYFGTSSFNDTTPDEDYNVMDAILIPGTMGWGDDERISPYKELLHEIFKQHKTPNKPHKIRK